MIKVAWFKAGATIDGGTSHQGVADANAHIAKKNIQKQDIINLQYLVSNNIAYYVLTYHNNDSETVL